MNQVHQILQRVRDPAALFDAVAALEEFASTHPQLDRESGADGFPYRRQHLARKADTTLERAAVSVGTAVEIRGEELVQQPAVAGMDHDHLITCPFRQARFLAIGPNDIRQLLLREGLDRPPVGAYAVARAPLAEGGLFVLVGHVSPGILAGMREFDARHGAVAPDGIGHESMCRQASGRLQVEVQHVAAVGPGMDHQFADGHGCGTTLGAQFVEALDTGARAAIGRNVGSAHRRGPHPVAENGPSDPDGAGQ